MCDKTMPKRKDISNDLKEVIIDAHQSAKGYLAISLHCTVREAIFTRRLWQIDVQKLCEWRLLAAAF